MIWIFDVGIAIGACLMAIGIRGDYYSVVDGVGVEPPKVCPRCGAKTRRHGNRHQSRVYCTSQAMVPGPLGYPVKACTWEVGVYRRGPYTP